MYDLINPATGAVFRSLEMTSADGVDQAVARAREAFPAWRDVAPADRARLLRRFADLVDSHTEELARIEVENAGHTISNARWEAGNVRDVLTYYAAAPERLFGRQIPVAGGLDLTIAEPLGVVGVIVPWNFPMPIAAWGFAPALAAGNTVVLKPAETTPLTALRLAEIALEAGLPEGVLQVVPGFGPEAGARLVEHPDVRKIVFTGSSAVGRSIMARCAADVKRVTLELGGKSPNIVFADADIEKAAASAPYGVFDNAGQDCCARSRILVESSAYDEFLEHFLNACRGVVIGDLLDEKAEMGPLISATQKARVSGFVDRVPADRLAYQGEVPDTAGFWFPPTVVTGVSADDEIQCEEVFGPVVTVVPFSSEQQGIELANLTQYGLSGSIWTRDLSRALRVSRAVQAGNLSVNSNSSVRYSTPFGGYKQSGLGRELGPDALAAFTETKNVFIAL
ncbi:Aldehyde Dehydrogenase [Catenulispora acidiphila DSM 44928]|uniref:Aldehyde Dehydrogenase n=1 Tax=Catenulispora acidiphila (strain DSM 44928 / JCM 14897 / NBRC 102108 / NRRL B-24433 / ID139908) TaxID=479433 RepID=C7QD10_CATAD|nr:aldehyde dehydrogenase family protein [Catenulispora acidiphila]ACU70720.1 Aldehyde Dehydrogenase [Catenulispora acidiphila DSM 44928]